MKIFQASLTKTYTINIVADDKEQAKRLVEFHTGDIQDISTEKDRLAENFSIEQIKN